MLIQRKQSNKELRETKKSKSLVSIQGRLYIDCLVQSITKRGKILSRQLGENSGNMKDFNVIFDNAINNAIYKHMEEKGVSGGFVIHIYDHWIKYFNGNVKVKRVLEQEFKIIETKPYTRILKEEKIIKVKPYLRNNKPVKGYTRKKIKYTEQLVKGYQRKIPIGKAKYQNKVYFNDKELLKEDFTYKKTSSLRKDLEEINKVKRKRFVIDNL